MSKFDLGASKRGLPRLENKKKKRRGRKPPLNGAGFPPFVGVVLVAPLGCCSFYSLLLGGAVSFSLILFLFFFKLSLLSPPPSFVFAPRSFRVVLLGLLLLPSSFSSFGWRFFPLSTCGISFLVCACTKCLTTHEEGRKQQYSKEEEAGGTTQKKGGESRTIQEGQTALHQRRKKGKRHHPREGRRRHQHPRRERDKVE